MKKFLILVIFTILTSLLTFFITSNIYENRFNKNLATEKEKCIKNNINCIMLNESFFNFENFEKDVQNEFANDSYFIELYNYNKKVLTDLEEYNTKKLYPIPLSYRSTDAKNSILEDITIFYCIPRYNSNNSCKKIYDKYFSDMEK